MRASIIRVGFVVTLLCRTTFAWEVVLTIMASALDTKPKPCKPLDNIVKTMKSRFVTPLTHLKNNSNTLNPSTLVPKPDFEPEAIVPFAPNIVAAAGSDALRGRRLGNS